MEKPQSYAAGVYNIGDMNSSFSKGPLRKLHAPSVGSIPPALNSIEKQEAIGFESPKPTMEFNYAVNYVAKIKKTFENQPSIYERFLQILHQYQARRTSQEAIESVKAEVNRLFYGHPDLLDEFNYFLPESLPEGTSEGATMSPLYASQMGTMPGINSQSAYQYQMSLSQSKRSQGVPRAPQTQTAKVKKGQVRDRTKASSTQNLQSASPSQLQQLSSSAQKIPAIPPDSRKEMAVLEYIKGSLPRPVYIQFLRCLNLYAKKILDKSELVCLLEDLFAVFSVSVPKSQEILTRFKENVLEYSDWEESHSSHLERKNYYSFIASMAGQNCPRVTPSYLELPKNVARPYYSGRTTLCDSVLNESAVSVPKGSEGAEEESSKSFRRNQYEEAIFHVEDQRYEVERLIELCDFSIKNLTEIYDEIEPLGPDKGNLVPFEDKLDVLTIKTVSQIYSEQWYECLFSLKENAFRTIPLILSRLEQKKKEWGQLKKQLRRSWRNTLAENHHRSLDHRSFSFKLEERKRLTSRNLIAEFHDFKVKSLNSREDPQGRNEPSGEMASFIKSDFRDEEIHVKILDLVLEAVEKVSNITDIADKVNVFWKRFIGHIFDIEFEVLSSVDLVDKEEQMDVPNQLEALKAKPLRVMIETWDIQEKLSPIRRHQRPSNLFFGNYQFLIFFRLYELLYSRLSSCKAMCLEQSPKDIETLWTTINDFLNCRIDASKYEDELRSKVGAGSYVLFTIDRLLSLLMKQLLNLVTLPVNQKLLSLYFYEFARVKDYGTPLTLENSALFARMYLSNAVAILSDQLACVQVEFYKDTRELTMDLFEGLSAPEPKNVDPEWSGYLESYLGELEDENRSNASNPFLKRSLLQTKADPKSHGDFWLVNGLEGKICMKTYRVRYVEETEDVFVKRKSRTYNRKSFEEGALKFRKRMKL